MHVPVLQKEVLDYLEPSPNENFIDCTIGEGGHTLAILEKTASQGKVLGIDRDRNQIENCKLRIKKFLDRIILVNDSYTNLRKLVEKYKFGPVSGILFDLGMSSWHLEKSQRGFSFQKDEPLDMRYDNNGELTAQKILNEWSEKEIKEILKEYGEERFAQKIASKIVVERKKKPIKTTFQLIEVIKKATPFWYHRQKIHFATRTFQALRIAVNQELDSLKEILPQALEVLKRGGRLAIISFHSLEDKIVKIFFREEEKKNIMKILTKKPITPQQKEISVNSRCRSAKLRAAIKI